MIQVTDRIVKAFQDTIQVELIKVRWEEIKKLSEQTTLSTVEVST